MKDIFRHFSADGISYPFAFNINVIEQIQDEYGSEKEDGLTKWGNLLEPKSKVPSMKALKFMMMTAINEGIDIENEEKGEKREFLTLKQVGRIISKLDNNGLDFAMDTISKSNNTGKEKNLITEQNQMNQ